MRSAAAKRNCRSTYRHPLPHETFTTGLARLLAAAARCGDKRALPENSGACNPQHAGAGFFVILLRMMRVGRSVSLVLLAALADPRCCTLPHLDQFDDLVLVGRHSQLPCALQRRGDKWPGACWMRPPVLATEFRESIARARAR